MDVKPQRTDAGMTLVIRGRIDATWAEPLTAEIDRVVRDGNHDVALDLRDVSYVSSAGIRVLLTFHKQLRAVGGSLRVVRPSDPVKQILELSGLTDLLRPAPGPVAETGAAATADAETPSATFAVHDPAGGTPLVCAAVGATDGPGPGERRSFPPEAVSIGIGSFGDDDGSGDRQGEFLAVAGAVGYLPPDDAAIPDYMLASGAFIPEMRVRHALDVRGTLPGFARFDRKPGAAGVPLSELADFALREVRADGVALVLMAESAGLVGACLRRSPAPGTDLFAFPGIRRWLSFSSEPLFGSSLALVAGVAARDGALPSLSAQLRPLSPTGALQGHFHAAAFSFAPFPRGRLDLAATVMSVFDRQTLQGLLHLLNDSRTPDGAGESLFRRGVLWMGGLV